MLKIICHDLSLSLGVYLFTRCNDRSFATAVHLWHWLSLSVFFPVIFKFHSLSPLHTFPVLIGIRPEEIYVLYFLFSQNFSLLLANKDKKILFHEKFI